MFVLESALIWVLVGVPQNLCNILITTTITIIIIITIINVIIIIIFNCIIVLLPDLCYDFLLKLMLFLFLP